MIDRRTLLVAALALLAGSLATAVAQQHAPPAPDSATQHATVAALPKSAMPPEANTSSSANSHDLLTRDARAERLEGEKRFQTNCGRCHAAPPKFPPRAMVTILRHMRVRALITDEDRRLILRYMTQ